MENVVFKSGIDFNSDFSARVKVRKKYVTGRTHRFVSAELVAGVREEHVERGKEVLSQLLPKHAPDPVLVRLLVPAK